ncbi:MAG: ABC transporter permease [Rhodospirillaceae bacterium]|nr:ABC transporter permease [Rhodospirillaceae bacterium]
MILRRHGPWALAAPSALFFLVFFVAPATHLFLTGFWRMRSYALSHEFNLENYAEVFEGYWDSLLFTFAMAFLIACCTTLVAFVFAYGTRFVFPRWSAALLGLILLTLFGGYLTKVYAWKTILGSTGVINSALAMLGLTDQPIDMFLYNPVAVVIALTHYLLPLAILPLYGSLRAIDDETLEAASDLGAGRWRGFRDVVLPQCRTGLIVSFTLTFLFTAGDYVTARLVGGPVTSMMGVFIQNQFGSRFNPPLGAAMSFTVIIFSALVIIVVAFTLNRTLRVR